jgi:hypothetical protein
MDLVAGDARHVLLVISLEDWPAFRDRERFAAHLSLGAGLEPTWLDLFAEAVRATTSSDQPRSFLDARLPLDGDGEAGERTIERVDPAWIEAIARLQDVDIPRVAGRWLDLLNDEFGPLPREEKPWIRELAGQIVTFARDARAAPDVLFAWSI